MKELMTIIAPRCHAEIYHVPSIDAWWDNSHPYPRLKPFRDFEIERYGRFVKKEITKRGLMVRAFMRGMGRNNSNGRHT